MTGKRSTGIFTAYTIFVLIVLLLFAFLAVSGNGYTELARSGAALHAVISIGVHYFAVALVLLLGLILHDNSMLFAGFLATAIITLVEYIASVAINKPPVPVAAFSAVVSMIMIWVPHIFCMRRTWRLRSSPPAPEAD